MTDTVDLDSDPCAVSSDEETASSAKALQAVAVTWGSVFLVLLFIFSLIKNRFKNLYNCRGSVPELHCELATKSVFPFGWIPGVLKASDDDLYSQCGFDQIAFCRLLRLGTKLALMGCFVATWLAPAYYSSPTRPSNALVTDAFDMLSLGHLHTNDPRLLLTVFACYVVNVFAMYLLYQEFSWYIARRHDYKTRDGAPENYSCYVGGVPDELMSKRALTEHLNILFKDDVFEVHPVRTIANLEKLCAEKKKVAAKLEHAKLVLETSGKRPTHKTKVLTGSVDSIDEFQRALDEVQGRYDEARAALEQEWDELERTARVKDSSSSTRNAAFVSFKSLRSVTSAVQNVSHELPFHLMTLDAPKPKYVFWSNVGLDHWRLQMTSILAGFLTMATCLLWTLPVAFIATLAKVGELKERFTWLQDASDALIVGERRLFDDLLAALAPLMLVVLNSLLPTILGFYCQLEGHIGQGALQASLFSKLTLFQIVQTFFVSAIAGSLFAQINCLVDDPAGQTIKILATSLPSQAVTFMGLSIVQSLVGTVLELLRIAPAALALLRRFVGPNLSEGERRQPFLFLSPLCEPGVLDYARLHANVMLLFMVLFVYSILSPVASFVILLGFLFLQVGYRNQMIYVYDPSNDTGGKMWPSFAGYIVLCMLIAQVTILGVMALKEGGAMVALTFPLPVLTILFWRYLGQQHLRVAEALPLSSCYRLDRARGKSATSRSFLRDAYKQEALRDQDVSAAAAIERGNGAQTLSKSDGTELLRFHNTGDVAFVDPRPVPADDPLRNPSLQAHDVPAFAVHGFGQAPYAPPLTSLETPASKLSEDGRTGLSDMVALDLVPPDEPAADQLPLASASQELSPRHASHQDHQPGNPDWLLNPFGWLLRAQDSGQPPRSSSTLDL